VSRSALILVDMINAYDFPDAEKVAASAQNAVPVIRELLDDTDGPVIYVNDNFGHWRSNRDDALFVVKARHSIFYQTPLEYL